MDLEISLNIDAFAHTPVHAHMCAWDTPTHTYRVYYVRALLFFRIPIFTVWWCVFFNLPHLHKCLV